MGRGRREVVCEPRVRIRVQHRSQPSEQLELGDRPKNMRIALRRLLLVLIVVHAACGATSTPTTSISSGLDFSIPDSWQVAAESLTPNLSHPREVVSLGTFRLRPGGPQCAQVPVNALHDLGATDSFVTLQERLDPIEADVRAFPNRPPFLMSLQGIDDVDAVECMNFDEREDLGTLRWLPFQESGRFFYLLIAIGRDASAERFEETVEVLDARGIAP